MGIAERRVQEHISDAGAADVQRFGSDIREDDAVGVDATGGRLGPYTGLPVRREAQQPQHGVGHAAQDVAPGREGLRVVLVELVGARVDNPVLRQAHLRAGWQARLVQDILQGSSGTLGVGSIDVLSLRNSTSPDELHPSPKTNIGEVHLR